jgi:hypothetical protein
MMIAVGFTHGYRHIAPGGAKQNFKIKTNTNDYWL